jgi:organic hydroperoxide reductase OsmC/OhrA
VEVEQFLDTAEGVVNGLPEGRCRVSEVILKLRITLNSHQKVGASAVKHFHELAQRDCFIAQLIKTKVTGIPCELGERAW